MLKPHQAHADKLAECRGRIDQEINAQLEEVEKALASGESNVAKQLLGKIDNRYGGLAAPRSVELATR